MKKLLSIIAVLISFISLNGYASDSSQQESGKVEVGVVDHYSDPTDYYDTREGSYAGMIRNHCDQRSSGIDEDCVAALPITGDYCDARFSEDCY